MEPDKRVNFSTFEAAGCFSNAKWVNTRTQWYTFRPFGEKDQE